MSIDAGGLAQMTYNNNNNINSNGFHTGGLGVPASGFGSRGPRLNPKRLSVALPPKVAPINEDPVDNPTPRTSRSHLLAGLRTQPKAPGVPASAPYYQTQHRTQGLNSSKWADPSFGAYGQGVPQTATGTGFDLPNQYSLNPGRQMYSLPEQVLAPPSLYDAEEMDPSVLQQMQMTSLFLAQRQQQLQQQLANITAAAQGMNMNGNMQRAQVQHAPMTPQTPQNFYSQQQSQQMYSPIEVPGQPGLYLVFNPAVNGYTYAYNQQAQQSMQYNQMTPLSPQSFESAPPGFGVSPPDTQRSTPINTGSITPPQKEPTPPSALSHVEPLPPPSANAFRRGHKKASSLAINPLGGAADGPKTASIATFGTQRSVFPPTPMTGTFGPGAARAGEHPIRQPRGPPPLEELTAAPTSNIEGSKNFATRQRRRALDNLVRAGTNRRGISRSSGGSPVSESDFRYPISEEGEDRVSTGTNSSRIMSPIGSEMKEKRNSQGSADGYFGLSSASSSEGEDMGMFKPPSTPATPAAIGGDRKKMMLGVLNAAEKRKTLS